MQGRAFHYLPLFFLLLMVSACAQSPLIIAHRGASFLQPEETLGADTVADGQGADFIELDLVPTKDGTLIARHENNLAETTDVAAHIEFAARHVTKIVDGHEVTGWFSEDFTLAEIKTLRARERLPELRPQSAVHDGDYEIATLPEIIDLLYRLNADSGRHVGLYIETKHPTYFAGLGLALEPRLAKVLADAHYAESGYPLYLESFDADSLRILQGLLPYPRVQLVENTDAIDVQAIATYAQAIGPERSLVTPQLIADAHAAGLDVHVWTLRPENNFLPHDLWIGTQPRDLGDFQTLLRQLRDMGVDGVFTDAPGLTRADLN